MKRALFEVLSCCCFLTFLEKSFDEILLIIRKLKMEIMNVMSSYEKQMDWCSMTRERRQRRVGVGGSGSLAISNYIDPQVSSSLSQLQRDNN